MFIFYARICRPDLAPNPIEVTWSEASCMVLTILGKWCSEDPEQYSHYEEVLVVHLIYLWDDGVLQHMVIPLTVHGIPKKKEQFTRISMIFAMFLGI